MFIVNDMLGTVQYALSLALTAHGGQKRDNGIPFICHPIEVATTLWEAGIYDPDVLTAAICHDILEDTDATEENLQIAIGSYALNLVKELTRKYPEGTPRYLKIQDLLDHARNYSEDAKWIKTADRFCNLRDALETWKFDRAKRYAGEALQLYEAMNLTSDDPKLFKLIDDANQWAKCIAGAENLDEARDSLRQAGLCW